MGLGFLMLCLRFGGMRRGIGRRRMRLRRMLRGRMGLGCMLICIARRGIWGMRGIGIGRRGGGLGQGVCGWGGGGLGGGWWGGGGGGGFEKNGGALHWGCSGG